MTIAAERKVHPHIPTDLEETITHTRRRLKAHPASPERLLPTTAPTGRRHAAEHLTQASGASPAANP